MTTQIALSAIIGAALCAVPASIHWSHQSLLLSLDTAEARIGRPLTPLSVAGVHRRAVRRSNYGYGYTPYAYGYAPRYASPSYGYVAYSSYGYAPAPFYGGSSNRDVQNSW